MTTITIHPKHAPQVLVGDLDILGTTFHSYARHDNDVDREAERLAVNRLSTHGYGVKVLSGTFDDRFAHYARQYSTRTFYHNYTNHPVTIVERSGLPMVFMQDPRRSGYVEPGVLIRKEIFYDSRDTGRRTLDALRAQMPLQGRELTLIKEQLTKQCNHTGIFGAMIAVEYFIREDQIENAERAIYHQKTDIVVSFNAPALTPPHPASSEFVETDTELFRAPVPMGQQDLSLILRYVSDDPAATPKYMRFANKVFALKPESNHPSKLMEVASREKSGPTRVLEERGEYIEFVYPASLDTGNPSSRGVRVMRIGLDEAKMRYGVFDSYQDISEPKEVLEATNRKLKDKLDFEAQASKRQAQDHVEKVQTLTRDYEDRLLLAQVDLRQRQDEINELRKATAVTVERIRNRREIEAHRQKVGFENIKFITNIVTIFVGMLPLLIRLKTSAK